MESKPQAAKRAIVRFANLTHQEQCQYLARLQVNYSIFPCSFLGVITFVLLLNVHRAHICVSAMALMVTTLYCWQSERSVACTDRARLAAALGDEKVW
jgi:hypothetical protein